MNTLFFLKWFYGANSLKHFLSVIQAHPFWYKCVYILVWVKVNLYKYISCWLITVSKRHKHNPPLGPHLWYLRVITFHAAYSQ